jgi:hypothetical protein
MIMSIRTKAVALAVLLAVAAPTLASAQSYRDYPRGSATGPYYPSNPTYYGRGDVGANGNAGLGSALQAGAGQ